MQFEPHLQDYLHIIRRRKWILITCFTVIVVSMLIWSLKQTPVYKSTVTILIEPRSPKVLAVKEVAPMGAFRGVAYRDYYETQYKLIKSRMLMEKVADSLGPKYGNNPDKKGNSLLIKGKILLKMLLQKVADSIGLEYGNKTKKDRDNTDKKGVR